MIGKNFKLYGAKHIFCQQLSVGDNCWLQALSKYKNKRFNPSITIGSRSMLGNGVHISSVQTVTIGQDCLLGSYIYISDHSHGTTAQNDFQSNIAPALRDLEDIAPVLIGDRVWIGDGVVILAGTVIPDGSVIGANSVVKGKFPACSIIAGVPAKVVRSFK